MQGLLLKRQMIKIVPYGPRSASGYEKLVRADAGEGLS